MSKALDALKTYIEGLDALAAKLPINEGVILHVTVFEQTKDKEGAIVQNNTLVQNIQIPIIYSHLDYVQNESMELIERAQTVCDCPECVARRNAPKNKMHVN